MTRSSGIIVGVILLTLSAITVFAFTKYMGFVTSPAATTSRSVFYEVKKHTSPHLVAEELQKAGATSNARLFYWYGRLTGKNQKIKAGDYRFNTAMKPDEVFTVLMSGISYGIPLTVPEGHNLKQIAQSIEVIRPESGSGQRFYELCTSKEFVVKTGKELLGFVPPSMNLEGYLFPDTYSVTRRMTEEELIHQMILKFKGTYTAEYAQSAQALGFNMHQAVTLASIIEKETGAGSERQLISSIFHNRLKKKMKLQTDPTVIYGLGDKYDGNIHKGDLLKPSPYNTYVIYGLPIGPISNPGREALFAALHPAESDYLFFVSHNDGTHEFTSTYKDHENAVKKFQIDRRAREGKSWRDLKKAH